MTIDWQKRWEEGRIGFHAEDVNKDLVAHRERFLGTTERTVLVPLAGKTHDIPWLIAQGHNVIAVELVPEAVETFFQEQGLTPERIPKDGYTEFRHDRLRFLAGDIFRIPKDQLGPVDRIWDRAALVALPREQHRAYAATLKELCPAGLLLENLLEYDTTVMDGPPFSVTEGDLIALYGNAERLSREDIVDLDTKWRERGHDHFYSTTYLVRLS